MKNVRLFAVAAALGMFASTVAAAETTSKTTVKWTGADTIIKVDLGEEVVVPTLTAVATTTTKGEKCTNGTDANGDGYVDGNMYAVNPAVNAAQGWLYTDAKYWATNEKNTALYYLGLGGGKVTGGRFLAPGAAENEGTYTLQLETKNLADVDAVVDFLVEKEAITIVNDEDGYIKNVILNSQNYYYDKANNQLARSIAMVLVSGGSRHADDYIKEAIANYFVLGKAPTTEKGYSSANYTVAYVEASTVGTIGGETASYKVATGNKTNGVAEKIDLAKGDIVTVKQNRYGDYVFDDIIEYGTDKSVVRATGGDLTTTSFASISDLTGDAAKAKFAVEKFDKFDENGDVVTKDTIFSKADMTRVAIDFDHAAYSTAYAYANEDDDIDAVLLTKEDGIKTVELVVTAADGKFTKYDSTKKTYVALEDLSELFDEDGDLVGSVRFEGTNIGDNFDYECTPLTNAKYDAVAYYSDGSKVGYNKSAKKADMNGYLLGSTTDRVYYEDDTVYSTVEVAASTKSDIQKLGNANKITVVDITDRKAEVVGDETVYTGSYRLASFSLEKDEQFAYATTRTLSLDSMSFDTTVTQESIENIEEHDFGTLFATGASSAASFDAAVFDGTANTYGLYYVETPANDSDKYVLYTGKGSGITGFSYNVNASKQTVTAYKPDGKTEVTAKAVKLEGVWYPAFDTEEELQAFVYAVTGVDTALVGDKDTKDSTFQAWYNAAKADLDNGVSSLGDETLPTTAIQPTHKAVKCTYDSETEPTAVKVTADASKVNKDEAGIYDITYTADVAEGAENATATVKVVVAPKYVRTWGANGKVATLTSFYVSNPEAKYAEYKYDWTAKKVTVTYYNLDGSVSTTTVNSL